MRIAILLNARFPTEKAYGLQVQTMARGFLEAGAEVSVIYPLRSTTEPEAISLGQRSVEFISFGGLIRATTSPLLAILRFLDAVRATSPLRKWKPDIVIVNDPIQAAFIAPSFPVVWDLHDIPDLRLRSRRFLIKRIFKYSRGLISTNILKLEALKSEGFDLPPNIILPNPVVFDPERYQSIHREVARAQVGFKSNEKSVVYTGQLYDWKGVDTLIASASFINQDIRIHIIGGIGNDLERCKKLVSGLPGDSAKVILHGQKPPEEIPCWLRAADLVVIPNSGKHIISVRDTNPMKLYEAFAAESAIIASDLPSIREAVGGNEAVCFVRPDDPVVLADAINEVFRDPLRIDKMRLASSSFHGLLAAKERAEKLVMFFHQHLRSSLNGI